MTEEKAVEIETLSSYLHPNEKKIKREDYKYTWTDLNSDTK